MALIGTLPKESIYNAYKDDFADVYYKIVGVFVNTEKQKVRVSVRGFMSEYARHNQGIGIFKRVFYIPLDFFNTTAPTIEAITVKAYEFLKTLPEFVGCVDSLEEYTGPIDFTFDIVQEQEKTLAELIDSLKN